MWTLATVTLARGITYSLLNGGKIGATTKGADGTGKGMLPPYGEEHLCFLHALILSGRWRLRCFLATLGRLGAFQRISHGDNPGRHFIR